MTFRRDGKAEHDASASWQAWKQEHAALIEASGLPMDVMASRDAFAYFLDRTYGQSGWLAKVPWFDSDALDSGQLQALWSLILAAVTTFWEGEPGWSVEHLEKTWGPETW